ncbi:hypothetical protein Tco_1030096 [Tanacetum coccineum]|uniref:Uncharacterized protein n=1 Tax=Tanacetum coccineum TaxID=301880 RepID=A0ABQ5G5N2_9ASTR
MAKPILNETQAEQNLAEPRVESNVKFEFGKELLTELQNNTFSERCEEYVIGHISKVLEILDLDARNNVMIEENGNITTWEELVKKFFKRFYPLSCASNYDKMCDDDEEGNKEGLLNDEVSSNEEWEEHEYGTHPNDSFPKSYLNINNEKDKNHHNENNKDTDKLSDSEEFLDICTRECDSWAQTVNGVSSIYHDIFQKKDEGWVVTTPDDE